MMESKVMMDTYEIGGPLERGIDEVDRMLAASKNDLTLDFHNVTFISVDGLEWLEELLLRARSLGAVVRFVNVHPEQHKVFKVAHIDSLMEACGSPVRSGPSC